MQKTPQQKWNSSIIKFRKKCQQIIKVSNNIRYVGVINEYGRTLSGIIKPGIKPLLKSEQVKNEFFIVSTLMTLRKSPDLPLGKLDYVVLKHEKVSIVAFQRNKETYYVSISGKEKELNKIIPKIKKLI
ncbi:MAG TPA: hypothetical protein VFG25_00660 [Nitrosopumilaceae archaeon]|nr:hypothetical protein [Nitrosopumilaceae archaeon]